ncbi:putative MYND domain protein [Xylaria arbuscula]|nr:putative MYND domain protein [Xylaria arbuscula]
MQGTCNSCKKDSAELKRCSKCHTTLYCSQDCQKADWKMHKKVCGKQSHEKSGTKVDFDPDTPSPPRGLESPITKPFTRLDKNTYLYDRPEGDIYRYVQAPLIRIHIADLVVVRVLIDSYRLQAAKREASEGNTAEERIYVGAESNYSDFQKFLEQAVSRPGLLPPWWNASKQLACEDLSMSLSEWSSIRCTVKESEIVEHYGDKQFPAQLRMLAEMVTGRELMRSGKSVRQILAMIENRGIEGQRTWVV